MGLPNRSGCPMPRPDGGVAFALHHVVLPMCLALEGSNAFCGVILVEEATLLSFRAAVASRKDLVLGQELC